MKLMVRSRSAPAGRLGNNNTNNNNNNTTRGGGRPPTAASTTRDKRGVQPLQRTTRRFPNHFGSSSHSLPGNTSSYRKATIGTTTNTATTRTSATDPPPAIFRSYSAPDDPPTTLSSSRLTMVEYPPYHGGHGIVPYYYYNYEEDNQHDNDDNDDDDGDVESSTNGGACSTSFSSCQTATMNNLTSQRNAATANNNNNSKKSQGAEEVSLARSSAPPRVTFQQTTATATSGNSNKAVRKPPPTPIQTNFSTSGQATPAPSAAAPQFPNQPPSSSVQENNDNHNDTTTAARPRCLPASLLTDLPPTTIPDVSSSPHSATAAPRVWCYQPHTGEIVPQPYPELPTASTVDARRRRQIIESLHRAQIRIFVLPAANNNPDYHGDDDAMLWHQVRRIVGVCAALAHENNQQKKQLAASPTHAATTTTTTTTTTAAAAANHCCLFYQDPQSGQLFNFVVAPHALGAADRFSEYLDSFSGVQAMVALSILMRTVAALACAIAHEREDNEVTQSPLRPSLLALVLGLVLTEEVSLSWLNASMLIRKLPSVAAHTLTSPIPADSLRKLVIFGLALAGAASGRRTLQLSLTLAGVLGACLLLLSNLGSRAWYFLGWTPLTYHGPGADGQAFALSILCGLMVPYMGHRTISLGGPAAVEHVVRTAVLVAVVFWLTERPELEPFLIIVNNDDECSSDSVNRIVLVWWTVTLVLSLNFVRQIPDSSLALTKSVAAKIDHKKNASTLRGTPSWAGDLEQGPAGSNSRDDDADDEDDDDDDDDSFDDFVVGVDPHSGSPVGFEVPPLPNLEMDPTLVHRSTTGSWFAWLAWPLLAAVLFLVRLPQPPEDDDDEEEEELLEDRRRNRPKTPPTTTSSNPHDHAVVRGVNHTATRGTIATAATDPAPQNNRGTGTSANRRAYL